MILALYEHLKQVYNEIYWGISGETIRCAQDHRTIAITIEESIFVIIKLTISIPIMSCYCDDEGYEQCLIDYDYVEMAKKVNIEDPRSIDKIERIILYMLTEHGDKYEAYVPI